MILPITVKISFPSSNLYFCVILHKYCKDKLVCFDLLLKVSVTLYNLHCGHVGGSKDILKLLRCAMGSSKGYIDQGNIVNAMSWPPHEITALH